MRIKFFLPATVLSFIIFSFQACTDKSVELTPSPVTLDPSTASNDPLVTLGRVLFYDPHLSVNGSISCASCHKQAFAFSDNVPLSHGFENNVTIRNSLAIQNLNLMFADSEKLFWDGRVKHLDELVLLPILNHVEMGMGSEADIVERVRNLPYYDVLLRRASYGTVVVVDANIISDALTSFVSSIRSFNSRFSNDLLSGIEQEGQQLFFTKYNCNNCHHVGETNFYNDFPGGFENIGLDVSGEDNGRYNVTSNSADIGKFKVPNLNNVGITAPYMHDGRFSTLEEVLEHYSHGIADHPNLAAQLRDEHGQPIRMDISEHEKTAIIAFLNSFTDYEMISKPEYSNPFVH